MRKVIVWMAVLFGMTVTAQAQEYHRFEIFGGYSYFNSDQFFERESLNTPGYVVSAAGNVTRHFGLVGEVSGHYGKVSFPGIGLDPEFDADVTTFLFGPRVSAGKEEGINPFAHVLFGGARTKVENIDAETNFALAAGAGLDFVVSKLIAVRGQFDYLPIKNQVSPVGFTNDTSHNFRVSVGFVFRFGAE
ncbi:MAG TPA: outer membrane beta-barrel protein [Blastocatellia bacterium]|nr:outer membrane beta-barrel protein [Blastocatellia bacterium]